MRGVWEGSGTWRTTGLSMDWLGPALAVGAAVGAAAAVLTFLLEIIWWLVAIAAVLIAAAGAAVFWLRWKMGRYELQLAGREERLAVQAARRAELAAPSPVRVMPPQAPVQVVGGTHYHLYDPEAVEALARATAGQIRAIPGQAGDACAEGK